MNVLNPRRVRRSHTVLSGAATSLAVLSCLLIGAACQRGRPRTEPVRVHVDLAISHQSIDGFGTTASVKYGGDPWFQDLYYRDLRASILRVDVTPSFASPASDFAYNAPWWHNSPPLPGPDGNNVRTYRDASDYGRNFAGRSAPIVVMGPDIEKNLRFFDYENRETRARGEMARRGEQERAALSDFKLVGSVWSPPPWLKVSSGNAIVDTHHIGPKASTKWPFIWAGNFAGGRLDTSDKPLDVFDDRALGGAGPTSALTQFARGLAAYLLGFQRTFKTRFYALSIQNELTFETFYNSCLYRSAPEYQAALRAVRTELARHEELREIKIMGPEDLLGDAYSLWSYGAGPRHITKNLGFLNGVLDDPNGRGLIDLACIHGYANDGVSSAGEDAQLWKLWAHGWNKAPAEGLPERVRGFRAYNKKSWMTETSGERDAWLMADGSFPSESAFGVALKIHQALTSGEQSAWIYWQLADDDKPRTETLTDGIQRERAPKYIAAKHYFHFIRPGARRVFARADGEPRLSVSAYEHARDGTLVLVLLNQRSEPLTLELTLPTVYAKKPIESVTSSDRERFKRSVIRSDKPRTSHVLPGFGVTTLVAHR